MCCLCIMLAQLRLKVIHFICLGKYHQVHGAQVSAACPWCPLLTASLLPVLPLRPALPLSLLGRQVCPGGASQVWPAKWLQGLLTPHSTVSPVLLSHLFAMTNHQCQFKLKRMFPYLNQQLSLNNIVIAGISLEKLLVFLVWILQMKIMQKLPGLKEEEEWQLRNLVGLRY